MLANIPNDLTHNEFHLLLHLATFQIPAYFEDIHVTFLYTERNREELSKLLLSLQNKRYAFAISPDKSNAANEDEFAYMQYAVTDLGRIIAADYIQLSN